MSETVKPFVPIDFHVPERLETAEFRLRMLTIHDLVKDFEAVVTSAEHLQQIWQHAGWPVGLTLEQNLIDLGWHHKEFQNRTSFAYTVVSLDESQVLGCVYVDPSRRAGHDAEAVLWARQSLLASGFEDRLYAAVRVWLATHWPFAAVAFPGREISWSDWRAEPAAVA